MFCVRAGRAGGVSIRLPLSGPAYVVSLGRAGGSCFVRSTCQALLGSVLEHNPRHGCLLWSRAGIDWRRAKLRLHGQACSRLGGLCRSLLARCPFALFRSRRAIPGVRVKPNWSSVGKPPSRPPFADCRKCRERTPAAGTSPAIESISAPLRFLAYPVQAVHGHERWHEVPGKRTPCPGPTGALATHDVLDGRSGLPSSPQ